MRGDARSGTSRLSHRDRVPAPSQTPPMQPLGMGDFGALLAALANACQELEQIKAEQTRDHQRVSESFERSLLAALQQEQSVLSRVESEHARLREQLTALQQENARALQDGAREITGLVREISSVSSQLKRLLETPGQNEPMVEEVQRRISNVFLRKNGLRIGLKKVHFVPKPLPNASILGEISCEERPLSFSGPYLNRKTSPLLLSDEKPPWVRSQNPEDFGSLGVKILLEDDSDGDSGSGSSASSLDIGGQQRDQPMLEVDSKDLSPQLATQKWISDIKSKPLRSTNKTQEASKTNALPPTKTKKNLMPPSGTALKKQRLGTQRMTPAGYETRSTVRQEVHDQRTANHNTLFKATAALIQEGDSDTSEDTIEEEIEAEPIRDPKTCRQVALRGSREPSAKKESDGAQRMSWMIESPPSPPSSSQEEPNGKKSTSTQHQNVLSAERSTSTQHQNVLSAERSTITGSHHHDHDHQAEENLTERSYLEGGPSQLSNKTQPGIDYLRMSNEKSDSLNGDFFLAIPRPASPAESVESSYTFIIENPKNKEVSRSGTFRVPKKPTNDPGKSPPVIPPKPQIKQRMVSKIRSQAPQPVPRSYSMPYIDRLSRPRTAPSRLRRPASAKERRDSTSSTSSSWSNPRSVSTSDQSEVKNRVKSAQYSRRVTKQPQRCLSKSECDLSQGPLEAGDPRSKPVRQFGKFGSGRAELNLPHGIHVSATGSVYIVDYGNRRLQVMDTRGKLLQQFALEAKNYFDVAVSNRGLVALTNSTDRSVDVYSKHGRLLHVVSRNWGAPRGIAANFKDEFIVADMKLGVVVALLLDPATGRQKESTRVPGFNKPYLVSCNSQGLVAVSERGPDGGCCVKVLREDWQLLRVLGVKESPGPRLSNPWGVCVDSEGGVLVADWGHKHTIVYYPTRRPARVLVRDGLSSPRGLALWQDTLLMVADSMHNCIKAFRYQESQSEES